MTCVYHKDLNHYIKKYVLVNDTLCKMRQITNSSSSCIFSETSERKKTKKEQEEEDEEEMLWSTFPFHVIVENTNGERESVEQHVRHPQNCKAMICRGHTECFKKVHQSWCTTLSKEDLQSKIYLSFKCICISGNNQALEYMVSHSPELVQWYIITKPWFVASLIQKGHIHCLVYLIAQGLLHPDEMANDIRTAIFRNMKYRGFLALKFIMESSTTLFSEEKKQAPLIENCGLDQLLCDACLAGNIHVMKYLCLDQKFPVAAWHFEKTIRCTRNRNASVCLRFLFDHYPNVQIDKRFLCRVATEYRKMKALKILLQHDHNQEICIITLEKIANVYKDYDSGVSCFLHKKALSVYPQMKNNIDE